MKVVLIEDIHDSAKHIFLREGYKIESFSGELQTESLATELKDASVLGIRSGTQVTSGLLESAPSLKAIGVFSVGMDNIDLDAAERHGVKVFNAPLGSTRSVVELAIGGMITLARRIVEMNELAHKGVWGKSTEGSYELHGKTLGIIGYGNIGVQLSTVAESFGVKVIYYDKSGKPPVGGARPVDSMGELLKESDFVSIHINAQNLKKPIVGRAEFEAMKPTASFLNLSRGSVVDEDALAQAVKGGVIAGAFIDVYENEPATGSTEFTSPLQGVPNIVMTPHIGGSTEQSQQRIGEQVASSLVEYMASV